MIPVVYILLCLFNVWSYSIAISTHISRRCLNSKLIRFNPIKLFSNSDDKYVPPPPPVGTKGEWSDWENDNYVDEPSDDLQEGDSADPFFSSGLSVPKASPSEFEAGWSEEPPYFDEDDQDDYEHNKFGDVNDLTSPTNEIMPKVSNKALFASSFTPTMPTAAVDRNGSDKRSDIIQSESAAMSPMTGYSPSIETIRNVVIDQNTILELKLQAVIKSSIEAIKDSHRGNNNGESNEINNLRLEMVNLSNKLNLALLMLGVSFLINILALNAS